tara:strand:- start:29232 stop:29756 length:525 start_codon:yes stop_codon:yes gene_type:complete
MVKRALLISFILLASCANLSKNQVLTENFKLRGGQFANQRWDDSLEFTRLSWYTELTLVYDLLTTKLDEKSRFWLWLSNAEKQTLAACDDYYIVIAYSQNPKKVSHTMFKEAAFQSGYRSVALNQFSNYLELHPDFAQNSFHLYNVFGLCLDKKMANREDILLQFPNFKEVVLK